MSTALQTVVFVCLATVILAQQGANPPPPPFLEGAPKTVIDEFHKLLSNSHTKTDDAVDKEVEDWVSQQSPAIKLKFTQFKAQMKDHESKAEQAHNAAIAAFSPEAKAADAKLSELANNPTTTAEQKGKEIEKYVNSLSPTVRAEIEKAMQG